MSYDLFISYSRRDNHEGRITQLVDRIKEDFAPFARRKLVPFFDREEILGMQDWRQRILQGLRESRLLLACLSPAFLASEYCQWEFVEYLKYEVGHRHGFNSVAPIYFVQVPGWDNKEFDRRCSAWVAELRRRQNFDLRPWYEQGEEALRETAVKERMEKLNRQIAEIILRGERAEKSLGNVDGHNPHFIGRLPILRTLRDNFVNPGHVGVVTAVNGVGGLGKTALAIEYAHSFADEYGGGRWQVRCAGKDDLRLALAELATPMGFEFTEDEKKNPELTLERVRRELKKLAEVREPHRCLLLLDNVDRPPLLDPAMVERLNGGDWLHILATTRLGENELYGAHKDRTFLAVDELAQQDALALIESYQRDGAFRSDADQEAAKEIVRLVGCFTLAVESVAVYLGQYARDVTCVGFLSRLKKEGLEGLESAAAQSTEAILHGEKRLSATLGPTLERLGAAERLALEFAAVLPPDQVALPWLRTLVGKTFPELERDAEPGYPDSWKSLLRSLLSLRLLQATDVVDEEKQPCVVRVHRLVQQLVFRDCPDQERATNQQAVDALITERCATLRNITNWVMARWELEPLAALANQWDQENHPNAAWLLTQAGLRLQELAEWCQCEPLLRRALAIDERSYGPDDPKVAIRLNNLAQLLQETNRLLESEPLLRRALAIHERCYGPEHQEVAFVLRNLAYLLHATNQLADAERLYRRTLAIIERGYGSEHPNVAAAVNNLAQLLQDTKRLAESEPLYRRALAIYECSYGRDHPSVASVLNNLAQLLQDTNRLAEAEPLIRRALAIDERSYGPIHPKVAIRLNNLARLLKATNRLTEAEPLYRRSLAINERSYGPEHQEVVTVIHNLAHLLRATNRLVEAEPLMRRVIPVFEKSLGEEHPKVAIALNNLAQLLQATNRLTEAEPLVHRALAINERSYGPVHPEVASSLNNLAQLLQATDRLSEAEPLLRRALAINERSYGPDHPNVARTLANLGRLLQAMYRLSEAIPLIRRSVAICEYHYGPDDPNVAEGFNYLAQLLNAMNQLDEAEPLMRRALAIYERSYGPDHLNVAIALSNLAMWLQPTRLLSEDDPLTRHPADILRKFLHLKNVVKSPLAASRLSEAESMMRRALAIYERCYGPDHPNVAFLLHNLALLLQSGNRLSEAEPLARRSLEILRIVSRATGARQQLYGPASSNYDRLLHAMGRSREQIYTAFCELAREFPVD